MRGVTCFSISALSRCKKLDSAMFSPAVPRSNVPLLRLQASLLDYSFRGGADRDEEAGEFLRRVQDRLERAIDQMLLAKDRVAADAHHVRTNLVDDRLRWPG